MNNDEILEQPDLASKDDVYENEDELLEAIRQKANEFRSSNENQEENTSESNSENDNDEDVNVETKSNENNSDESFDIASWLKQNPFEAKDRDLTIKVDDVDEVKKLINLGLNYTRKTQELASVRKIADYAKDHSIEMSDLELLADLKSGNKDALGELAKRNNISIYDVDTEADYKPNEKVAYKEVSEVDLIAQDIAKDEVLYGKVRDALTYVPRDFAENVVSDAKLLSAFRDDVANGITDKVLPLAIKNHAIYGGDFIQHYVNIANELFNQNVESKTPVNQSVSPQTKAKASVGSSSNGTSSQELDLWENVSEQELIERIKRQASLMKG